VRRYLTLGEVVELRRRVLQAGGGAPGIRDLGALDSAVAQPKATFGGVDLYPTVIEKAAALCLSLVQNHPFVDGNKRVGHAAMERPSSSSTAPRSPPPSMTKSVSCSISPPAGSTGCT
jgi:prophage maintenance system killer protein